MCTRQIARRFDTMPTIIGTVTATLEPHRLAGHLYTTAQAMRQRRATST